MSDYQLMLDEMRKKADDDMRKNMEEQMRSPINPITPDITSPTVEKLGFSPNWSGLAQAAANMGQQQYAPMQLHYGGGDIAPVPVKYASDSYVTGMDDSSGGLLDKILGETKDMSKIEKAKKIAGLLGM